MILDSETVLSVAFLNRYYLCKKRGDDSMTSRTSKLVARDQRFLRRSEFLALGCSDFGILEVQ